MTAHRDLAESVAADARTRRAIAALWFRANRAIDDPFAEIADSVEMIVLRHATADSRGVPILDAGGASLAAAAIRRLLAERAPLLTRLVAARIAAAEDAAERDDSQGRE